MASVERIWLANHDEGERRMTKGEATPTAKSPDWLAHLRGVTKHALDNSSLPPRASVDLAVHLSR